MSAGRRAVGSRPRPAHRAGDLRARAEAAAAMLAELGGAVAVELVGAPVEACRDVSDPPHCCFARGHLAPAT